MLLAASLSCAAQSDTRTPLAGRSAAISAESVDLGPVAANTPIRRVQLVLARTPAQEQALVDFMAAQQDPRSADFHRWLTPVEFGRRFGPSDAALGRLTSWLVATGFTGVQVNAGRTVVELSGTAGTLKAAFHAEIHSLSAGGVGFMANTAATDLPADFAPIVAGIASLGSAPRAQPVVESYRRERATGIVSKAPAAGVQANYTLASNNTVYYALTPVDFATMYDVLPLWNAALPIDGSGQTIAVAGDSDIAPADFVAFRRLFGLPLGDTTTQTGTQYLNVIYNGPRPGLGAGEFHATADVQWAGAAARKAVIDYVASESTEVSSGADLSAAYIVDNNLAAILVDDFSQCELTLGTAGNAFYKALWQQAAAQGISVVTASGDAGAAGCQAPRTTSATHGAKVNGIGSTPYDIAVGGTDFYAPNGVQGYFGTTNDATHASLLSYIPEAVWNDSCTSPAILAAAPYVGQTAETACNSAQAKAAGLVLAAGSGGGASSCTVSNGLDALSCTSGYPKPSWQTGTGVPADGVRDVPDVALFASQGRANSFYVVCEKDRNADGLGCNLDAPYSDFAGSGGTELAAPAFASILALAAQKSALANNERIGNPGYVLYKLAAKQTASGLACNSTGTTAQGCYFHDITSGTNAMACVTGSPGCVTNNAGDAFGVLAGYAAGTGYDQATGLGSVDAANLVGAWTSIAFTPTAAVLSITPSTIVHGSSVAATVTVTGASTPTGQVAFNAQAATGSVGFGTLANGTVTATFRNFPGGTYGVQAHYAGDTANAPIDSNFVSLTVSPEPSTSTLKTLAYNPVTTQSVSLTSAPYGDVFYIRTDVTGQSGQGVATGNVTLTDNGALVASGVYRLNSAGYTEAQTNSLAPGTHVFAASYGGDSSFGASSAGTSTLTISRATTSASVSAGASTISVASTAMLTATLTTTSFGYLAPTGSVWFYAGTQLLGMAPLTSGTDATTLYRNATGVLTLSASAFAIGANSITVVYAGDTNYLGTTSSVTSLSVTDSALKVSTTTLSVTPGTVVTYGSVLLSAVIMPGSPVPAGTVQFIVDGQALDMPLALTGGQASYTLPVTTYKIGTHTVQAVYSGDTTNYRSSTSAIVPFIISAPTLSSLPQFTVTPVSAVQGTFISIAAKVPQMGPVATGTIQLVLDGGPYGALFPLSNGATVLPLLSQTLQVGPHVLTVYYSGDVTYAAGYAALPTTITITAPGATPSAVTITGLASQIALGSAASFTATVSPASPTPTGIFQIVLDGGNPGAPILLKGSTNSLSIPASSLPLGSHTVSVFYSGDATYNFSRSAAYSFNVIVPVVTGTFTLSPSQISVTGTRTSTSPTVPYTVSPSGGFTGTVSFSCNNLPANTGCSFAPSSVTLNGTANAQTVLTLQLNTGLKGAVELPFGVGGLALAGLLGMLWPGRRRSLRQLVGLVVFAGLAGLVGCGSGYAPGTSPPGNYTVQVVATSGPIVQTGTISLTIN